MTYKSRCLFASLPILTLVIAGACSDDKPSGGDAGTGGGSGSPEAGPSGGSGGGAATGGRSAGGSGGASGADGGACETGCACASGETCDYVCTKACTVECLGGTCTAACTGGDCTFDADFGAHTDYTCLGGGCHTDCDNGSTCNVDCSGGGCDVVCDGGSTCVVKCKPTGAGCTVACEAGSTATCASGNCTTTGCGDASVCDPTPDPNYTPDIVPAEFRAIIDNPLNPLPVGATWTHTSADEHIVVTVLTEKKTIMGVECVVVRDTVTDPSTGNVVEDTYDWFAQHADGSVWYFGEDTREYVNGQVASTAGSWQAGVNGALPGIVMPASPVVTTPPTPYRQEYYPCESEDQAQVEALDQSVTVTAGSYTGCIRTREFSRLEPAAVELKTYCPGVGVVLVQEAATGQRLEELTTFSIP